MSGVYFKALGGENQIIDMNTFEKIEKTILYELYQNNVTYRNAEIILKTVSERLKHQYLNKTMKKKPKDVLIEDLEKRIDILKNEICKLQKELEKKPKFFKKL